MVWLLSAMIFVEFWRLLEVSPNTLLNDEMIDLYSGIILFLILVSFYFAFLVKQMVLVGLLQFDLSVEVGLQIWELCELCRCQCVVEWCVFAFAPPSCNYDYQHQYCVNAGMGHHITTPCLHLIQIKIVYPKHRQLMMHQDLPYFSLLTNILHKGSLMLIILHVFGHFSHHHHQKQNNLRW